MNEDDFDMDIKDHDIKDDSNHDEETGDIEGDSNHEEEELGDTGGDSNHDDEYLDDSFYVGEDDFVDDDNNDEDIYSSSSGDDDEDIYSSSSGDDDDDEKYIDDSFNDEDQDDNDISTAEEEGDEECRELLSKALDVAEGVEISAEELEKFKTAANVESENRLKQRYIRYILCVNAAEHCGFIEPDFFGQLSELLLTDNETIRQCIMWAFASILPCKNVLSPLLIRLLYRSLQDEKLGWSISYLFRKMSEYNKYASMITCSM
mgnify:FL=1